MDRLEGFLYAASYLLAGVAFGVLGEEIEERIRTWWKARK
jgi:hypothetical protein